MSRSPSADRLFPDLGFGLGLRSAHYRDVLDRDVLEGRSSVNWFEVVSENFLGHGGRALHVLESVRKDFPVVLHGVSMSVGSTDPLNFDYLKKLKAFSSKIEPAMISDHCCWTSVEGENLHDLMPLPFTQEAIAHVADRVSRIQEFLGRRILLENVSSYMTFKSSEMTEWEFLSEICSRADCGLLLDVNNVYVSAINHGFDPMSYMRGIPAHRVGQIHLAGHTTRDLGENKVFLIDTHDHPVCPEVWSLYEKTLALIQEKGVRGLSTMIERDADIPSFDELEAELRIARDLALKITQTEKTLGAKPTRASSKADARPDHDLSF